MQTYAEKSASVNYLKCAKYYIALRIKSIYILLSIVVLQKVLDTVRGRAKDSFIGRPFRKQSL
jgi:hypothetical protein